MIIHCCRVPCRTIVRVVSLCHRCAPLARIVTQLAAQWPPIVHHVRPVRTAPLAPTPRHRVPVAPTVRRSWARRHIVHHRTIVRLAPWCRWRVPWSRTVPATALCRWHVPLVTIVRRPVHFRCCVRSVIDSMRRPQVVRRWHRRVSSARPARTVRPRIAPSVWCASQVMCVAPVLQHSIPCRWPRNTVSSVHKVTIVLVARRWHCRAPLAHSIDTRAVHRRQHVSHASQAHLRPWLEPVAANRVARVLGPSRKPTRVTATVRFVRISSTTVRAYVGPVTSITTKHVTCTTVTRVAIVCQ